MNDKQPKTDYWFKRKRYGWGWTPTCIKGWLLIIVYILVVLAEANYTINDESSASELILFYCLFFITTLLFITLTSLKSPKPRWRWGKKPNDNPEEDF